MMTSSPEERGNWLGRLLTRIDAHLREDEFFGNAIYPPFNPNPASTWQKLRERLYSFFRPVGHSASAGLALFLILLLLCFGPSYDWDNQVAVVLFGCSVVLAWLVIHYTPPRLALIAHLGLVAVIGITQWFLAGPDSIERDPGIYRHLLVPFSWVMIGVILVAWLLSRLLFKSFSCRFGMHLLQTELLTEPVTYPVGTTRFLREILVVPFYHPIYLLTPSALVALTVADRWMPMIAGVVLLASWLLLSAAAVHERLSMLMELAKRVFFTGGQLIVSIIVILIAALRLGDVHYVSFLIESHPNHVNLTIVSFVITAYAALWFYEYWINRLVNEHILNTMRTGSDQGTNFGAIEYSVATPGPADSTSRCLRLHGAGRFAVLDRCPDEGRIIPDFETSSRSSILDAVVGSMTPCVPQDAEMQSKNLTKQNDLSKLKQRLKFYFLILNLLFFAAFALPGYFYINPLPQKAEMSVRGVSEGGSFDLRNHLLIQSNSGAPEPAILLAASGGGSRAALYTESILRGLAKEGQLKNLILTSGVSGGGAALAYFAGHRDELVATEYPEAAWNKFSETMGAPFIQDVLEGVGEWRVVAWSRVNGTRMGVRLGELLSESFQARFFPSKDHGPMLEDVQDLGLILNIALTGHFPGLPSELKTSPLSKACKGPLDPATYPVLCEWLPDGIKAPSLAIAEQNHKVMRTSITAGGRMIITNLSDTSGFPKHGKKIAPSDYLSYVVLTDSDIDLATAAALNANFPPVFSNAAVDVIGTRRYWVTDGGSVDNRGILSLLYALKKAVQIGAKAPSPLRSTHVVIAEASAMGLDYAQNRGMGSIFSSSQKLASQLMLELIRDIEDIYKSRSSSITFHQVSMPMVLRSGGGVGTHWMLPAYMTFKQPLEQVNLTTTGEALEIPLPRKQVIELINNLHGAREDRSDSAGRVWQWIDEDRFTAHGASWQRLISSLKTSIPAQ